MQTFKRIGLMMMAALARMGAATATVTRWTLKAGKWVLETVAAPRQVPDAPVNEAAAAVEALAEASAIKVPAPTPAVAVDDRHDPVAAWGRTVVAHGRARFAGGPQPDLTCLDDAAQHWLHGLLWENHDKLARLTPREVGEHVLGIRQIPGVPRCPTAAEHADAKRIAREYGLIDAVEPDDVSLEDGLRALTSAPGWTPNTGIH